MSNVVKNKIGLMVIIVAMALLSSVCLCTLNWSYLIDCSNGFEETRVGILNKKGVSCYGSTEVEDNCYAGITVYLKTLDEDDDWVTVTAWEDVGEYIAAVSEDYACGTGTFRLDTTHKAFTEDDLETPVEMHYMESEEITIN